jgi:hypothetical protein
MVYSRRRSKLKRQEHVPQRQALPLLLVNLPLLTPQQQGQMTGMAMD